MDKLEAFRSIAAQASRGELSFPTSVKAALALKDALEDPDLHLTNAAKMVQAEPLMSARTVALANSVAYNRSGVEVSNVIAAVTRLGFQSLRTLSSTVIVRQLASKLPDPVLQSKAEQLWEHTAHVAALAHVIAKRIARIDPETAMFAGIVHEVGGFYLLSRAAEFPGLLEGNMEAWAEYGEKIIGRGVLKALEVPASVMTAVESAWQGIGSQPPKTLGDVLLLANQLAPVASPLQAQALAPVEAIDFAVGGDTLRSILHEADDELRSLAAVLLH
jgi:HD-like signal output (HDOD) protein